MSVTFLFPLGAILITLLSWFYPALLAPMADYIVPLLSLVMLGMGITLRFENFLGILRNPRVITIGVVLQFLFMPLFAWIVAKVFGLEQTLLIGLVLVGACPGGTASNVICYLARGDVALSIMLTTVTTILAVVMTPLLTWLYLGEQVEVPVTGMMRDILMIIVVPVMTGVLINHYLGDHLHPVKKLFPFVSLIAIIMIIGIVMALTRSQLHLVALPVLAAVVWHNLLGMLAGYYTSKWLGLDDKTCRTIAIEVGMQNSGLAVVLAKNYFSAMAALPAGIFSIWHNISGSLFAGYWARKMDAMKP
jgi:bile acid:Na+ symporter, BASS family